jgi:hypothetical protein
MALGGNLDGNFGEDNTELLVCWGSIFYSWWYYAQHKFNSK